MNENKNQSSSKENTNVIKDDKYTTNSNKPQGEKGKPKGRPHRNKDRSRKDSDPKTGTELKVVGNGENKTSEPQITDAKVNDAEWYVWNEETSKGYSDFAFNVKPGISYEATRNSTIANGVQITNSSMSKQYQMPGIAIYKYIPLYGNSTSPQSTINVVSQQVWKRVRNLLSNNQTRYEAADMFMYLLAMDQVYLMIHELKRIFRLVNTFTNENREIPRKILNALGFDFNDIVSNLANYRTKLNIIIGDVNTLYVPDIFDIFKRRAVMGQSIIMDDSSKPGQLIIPEASGYMVFDPVLMSTGSCLSYVDKIDMFGTNKWIDGTSSKNTTSSMTYTKFSMDKVLTQIQRLVQTLTLDQEISMMSGDISKAFDSQLFSLPYLGELETVDIVTDDNLREQFKNSLVLDIPGANYSDMVASGKSNKETQAMQDINLSPLRFSCAAPSGYTDPAGGNAAKNQYEYTVNKPLVYQKNGSIYSRATIYQCGGTTSQDGNQWSFTSKTKTSCYMTTAQLTNIASSLMLSTYLLDVYSDNPEWKLNLEWTRLMTIVAPTKEGTVNNSRGNFTYAPITDAQFSYERELAKSWNMGQSVTNANLTLTDFGTVHYGTELGIGWLVYTGYNAIRDGLNLPASVSNAMIQRSDSIVLTQFFQFNSGTLGTHNTALVNTSAGDLFSLDKSEVTILINVTTSSDNSIGNQYLDNGISKFNSRDVDAMMRGLDYAPRSYSVKNIAGSAGTRTTTSQRLTVDIAMESGKYGNRTAELSEKNIIEVHEAAFNGLFRKHL